MTISSYHVDTILRIYTRQNNAKIPTPRNDAGQTYKDKVTLSGAEADKTGAYEKISYSVLDVILANKREP